MQKSKCQTHCTNIPECTDLQEESDSDSDSDDNVDGHRYWPSVPAERIQKIPTVVPQRSLAITTLRQSTSVPTQEERIMVDYLPESEMEENGQDEGQSEVAGSERTEVYDEAEEPTQEEQPLVDMVPGNQTY